MIRRVAIWSVHDLSLRNPACWSRSWASTQSFVLSNNTPVETFPGIKRRVMPLYLSQLLRSSFLAILTRYPFRSAGTCSSSQILLKRMRIIFAVTALSVFSASAGMLSSPAALPLLICLMAILISSIVGGPTPIGGSCVLLPH
ncbi:unnamed protein product [Schistosoma margrebowiei]|uniref:Uncharacterized protein n=1 Tax=Schistosoma margrebowiei TaxID=48269 RepID=A0A183M0G0_9TREM|nr:unnamed protein product [Schistosoma margrebowiei]